jgi:hypothetical protein
MYLKLNTVVSPSLILALAIHDALALKTKMPKMSLDTLGSGLNDLWPRSRRIQLRVQVTRWALIDVHN